MNEEDIVILKEIAKWLRVLAFDKIRSRLADLTTKELEIYDLSTKENSLSDIEKIVGVGHSTINNKLKIWYGQGIMEAIQVRGGTRYVRLASLEELGIYLEKK